MSKLRQIIRLMTDPFTTFAQARAECGDLFALHVPGLGRVVFLCSASLLEDVYRRSDQEIAAGEVRKKIVGYLFGAKSSISIDGAPYAQRRRVMAPYFGGRGLARYTGTIHDLTAQVIDSWPRGQAFCLQPAFEEITVKTMCRILYGPLEEPANRHLARLSVRFLEAFRSPVVQIPPLHWNLGRRSPWGHFLAARQELRDALDTEIRRRAPQAAGAEDLISALIASGLEEDDALARETIVQETLNLLVGGGGTTATALTWTFLGLLSNPEALGRLRDEIARVLGKRPLDPADLSKMPYLDAVLQEGMRFRPVAPAAGPRVAKKDIRLQGFIISQGTVLMQCFSEVGRNPDVFPHPDRFEPENFFGRKVRAKDWMPFGGGSRVCTGMGLARLEMAVAVTAIVQKTELRLGRGSRRPVRCGVVYQPKNGLRVHLVRRLLGSDDP